jgi:hypothetical protein
VRLNHIASTIVKRFLSFGLPAQVVAALLAIFLDPVLLNGFVPTIGDPLRF